MGTHKDIFLHPITACSNLDYKRGGSGLCPYHMPNGECFKYGENKPHCKCFHADEGMLRITSKARYLNPSGIAGRM